MRDESPRPSDRHPSPDGPGEEGHASTGRSVLPRIERRLGTQVRVELRGGEGAKTEGDGPLLEGKYRLHGELGRGGVGVVLRGSDLDLGRDVAIKVLREEHHDRPDVVQRFVEEAQIGGQLQHPGVVPVYDLGLVDGRPFFAMKLVRGSSLETLLAARKSLREERRRFLGIFEQVCQTLAYAHERGVIHRDLKPGNVMVGAFGEVQVVDWGMGKVVGRSDSVAPLKRVEPNVETVRSGSADARSELGSMMGTLGYMPPEQVRGEIDAIDERSDVFSLGAILFEILTGEPPQTGTWQERLQMATDPTTWRIGERLAVAGVDADLVDLATSCLAPERLGRPRSAKVVAERAAAYLSAVEERAQRAQVGAAQAQAQAARAEAREAESRERATREEARAERERAEAERATLRAQAERRKRFAVLAVGGALVVAVVGTAWGLVQTGRARETDLQRRLEDERRSASESARLGRNAEAVSALLAESEQGLRAGDTSRARIALDAARRRADEGGVERDADRLERLAADLALLTDLDAVDQLRWTLTDSLFADPRTLATRTREALRRFGADPESVSVEAAAARMGASTVRERIVTAIDQWLGRQKSEAVRALLRRVDPDPFRDAVRDAVLAGERAKVAELASRPAALEQPPGFAVFLGGVEDVDVRRRVELLQAVALRWPANVNGLMALGSCYPDQVKAGVDPRIRWYQAAVAATPGNSAAGNNLGVALMEKGRPDEAISWFRRAIDLDSKNLYARHNLGSVLSSQGRVEEGIGWFRKALELEPAALVSLVDLSSSLAKMGQEKEALALALKAVELAPEWGRAHFSLGVRLGRAGRTDEAILRYRRAIELDPKLVPAYKNLGGALDDTGHPDEAKICYLKAVELDPDDPENYYELGIVARRRGLHDEALDAFKKSVALGSKIPWSHYGLGAELAAKQRTDEAMTAFRRAIELDPNHPEAHCDLASCLTVKGRLAEALEFYRRGHELGSKRPGWNNPSADWVRTAERRAAIETKLPGLLAGDIKARDDAERLELGVVCYVKKRYRASARFNAEAFAADPASADDLGKEYRYDAARGAALAAAGRGEDAEGLGDEERARLRKQTLDWLRADLALHAKRAETDERTVVTTRLRGWQEEPELAHLRDTSGLVSLPAQDRNDFLQLWVDVAALRAKAEAATPTGQPR